MYTWDLTPYSSTEWRLSHAYSHHAFPNTAYDYEVMVFEPYLEYLPVKKSLARLLASPLVMQLLACLRLHLQVGPKYAFLVLKDSKTVLYVLIMVRAFNGTFAF